MNGAPGTLPDEITGIVKDLLDAAILLKASDLDSCRPWPEIVAKAGVGDPDNGNVREAHTRIMKDELMKSRAGRGGGHWITDKGIQFSRTHKLQNTQESLRNIGPI